MTNEQREQMRASSMKPKAIPPNYRTARCCGTCEHWDRDAAGHGVSEWARRLRELRDEEGWPIRSKNDDAKLKPNEYRLDGPPPEKPKAPAKKSVAKKKAVRK